MYHNDIIESWKINASEWISAIEEQTIESRKVTNPAILKTIEDLNPSNILDLGCGEGWLTHKLNTLGIEAFGIDGTEQLITKAKGRGNFYHLLSYEEIIEGAPIPNAPYEAIVFNFCLYLKEGTQQILEAVKNYLKGRKLVVVQTLHPYTFISSGVQYQNQWLDNSWKGLKGNFRSPHKWYYRTLEGWVETIKSSGLSILDIKEPTSSDGKSPVSIIFTLTPNND